MVLGHSILGFSFFLNPAMSPRKNVSDLLSDFRIL
jgi:hypothetical protein